MVETRLFVEAFDMTDAVSVEGCCYANSQTAATENKSHPDTDIACSHHR
jgi:hypothetical protein